MPPEIQEIIEQAAHEMKRLGGDMQTLHDRTKQSVDGVHDRLDAMETAFKRNGGGINTKPETAEEREYKTAFDKFVRTGDIANLKEMQHKAASQQKSMFTGFDPDGGYLVPTELSNRIVQRVFEMSPMRSVAAVQTVSTGELEMLLDADEAEAVWVDETSPRGETRSPQLGKLRITVHEMSASPVVSQRLLEDSAIDVAGWLEKKIGDKFARKEGTAFVTGNGIGQPFGFLTRATEPGSKVARVYSGSAANIHPDSLHAAVYALKRAYRTKARWLMSRSAMLNIRTIKDEMGRYLWQPSLTAGQPDTLLGYPVVDIPDMPDVAVGTYSVAFGAWDEAYTVVDRLGITTLRDPFTKKPGVEISARKRVGGDVTNPEAFVLIKTGFEP